MVRASSKSAHHTSKGSAGCRLSQHTRQDNECPKYCWRQGKTLLFPKDSEIWIGGDLIISNRFGGLNQLIVVSLQGPAHPLCSGWQNSWVSAQRRVSHRLFIWIPHSTYRSWQPLPKPSSYPFSHIPWLKTARVSSSGKTFFPFKESPSGKCYKTKQDQRCYTKIKIAISIPDHTSSFLLWTTEGLVEQQPKLFWVLSSHM